jgi:opacity protein-like surface antigen
MKKLPIIALAVASLVFAGFAEAAKPRKRTRNASRIGPYGAVLVAQTRYPNDQSGAEQELFDFFQNREDPTRNISTSSKTEGMGYQFGGGYRFTRYLAAELALVQYGELSSSVKGEVDQGQGFIPVTVKYAFQTGGPMVSAVGFLPLGEKAELFARVGFLLANTQRETTARVDGQNGGSGRFTDDSSKPVYGVGLAWHINQIYTIRAEYQKLTDVGEEATTGKEDLNTFGLGLLVRF